MAPKRTTACGYFGPTPGGIFATVHHPMPLPPRPETQDPSGEIQTVNSGRRSASAIGARRRDEAGGRSVEPIRRAARIGDDRGQLVGEFLAEFDAPLIEGIDVPNRRLARKPYAHRERSIGRACAATFACRGTCWRAGCLRRPCAARAPRSPRGSILARPISPSPRQSAVPASRPGSEPGNWRTANCDARASAHKGRTATRKSIGTIWVP